MCDDVDSQALQEGPEHAFIQQAGRKALTLQGAGYAGGITSAACDGVRIAEKIAAQLLSQFESLEF